MFFLSLFAVAGVFFDPDVYMVPEGDNVTLTLRTNVTVNKRFRVIVNTVDDSANSKPYTPNKSYLISSCNSLCM